jgi:hypothetical protein
MNRVLPDLRRNRPACATGIAAMQHDAYRNCENEPIRLAKLDTVALVSA